MTKVTETNIQFVKPKNGLIGFASCVLNDNWFLGDIGIFSTFNGEYRLTYPTKKLKNGQNMNIIHPINNEANKAVKEAVLQKINELINEQQENELQKIHIR